jgi:hypothetical protein
VQPDAVETDPVATPGKVSAIGAQAAAAVKFATKVRFAVAVKLKLAFVETAVPPSVQLVKVNPVAAVATTVTEAF